MQCVHMCVLFFSYTNTSSTDELNQVVKYNVVDGHMEYTQDAYAALD